MRDDDLDRVLSRDEEIIPSSGFTANVMDAIRREAATLAPIPFPWSRALPGLAAAAALLIALVVAAISQWRATPAATVPVPHWAATFAEGAKTAGAGWVALALLVTLISIKVASAFARPRVAGPKTMIGHR